ncbi:hypothetical protein M9458_056972, partial [Cirrhinus mrigala]
PMTSLPARLVAAGASYQRDRIVQKGAATVLSSLHTMAVLQAYQADLLKDLDKGQGLSPDEVAELRRTMDLALRATKQAATAMGRSMVAMVVTERHLWVNLADLGKKEKGFLLDAPVSPSELFGTSEFKTFIPRRTRSEPEHQGGPGPQSQKVSVAARAPPPPTGGSRRGEVVQARRSQRSRPDQSK